MRPARKTEALGRRDLLAFLDFDAFKPPLRWLNPDEVRELVMIEARRLKELFNLGKAIIRRSDGGWHVKFSRPLTKKEFDAILTEAKFVDWGYKYWIQQHGGMACLRTGPKVIVKMVGNKKIGRRVEGMTPQTWEVIE